MKYVFCDTMTFLHFKIFTEIDFHSILGKSPITIVVPECISTEVDNHKDNHKQAKIRKRAKTVYGLFDKYLVQPDKGESEIKKDLVIKFLPYEKINYDTLGLDPQKQDHQLIGAIIKFKEKINPDDSITLITHDIGASLTAKRHEIGFMRLPDELRLTEELDEDEKRIKALEDELSAIKNAQPKLKIYAKDQKDASVIQLKPLSFIVPDVTPLEEEKAKFPKFKRKREEAESTLYQNSLKTMQTSVCLTADSEEISRYEKDRESYFQRYEDYLQQLEIRSKKCLAWINLIIENTGTAPAEGVDIYIHFPDGFELYPKKNIPAAPEKPRDPVPPRSKSQIFHEQIALASNIGFHSKTMDVISMANRPSFSLKKTHSYEFEDSIRLLKHGNHAAYEIIPLLIVFNDKASIKNFSATYRLSANNIQSAIEGELHFNFPDFKKD